MALAQLVVRANGRRYGDGEAANPDGRRIGHFDAHSGPRLKPALRRPNDGAGLGSIATSSTTGPGVANIHSSATSSSLARCTDPPTAPRARASSSKLVVGIAVSFSGSPTAFMPWRTIPYDESLSTIHLAWARCSTAVLISLPINIAPSPT